MKSWIKGPGTAGTSYNSGMNLNFKDDIPFKMYLLTFYPKFSTIIQHTLPDTNRARILIQYTAGSTMNRTVPNYTTKKSQRAENPYGALKQPAPQLNVLSMSTTIRHAASAKEINADSSRNTGEMQDAEAWPIFHL